MFIDILSKILSINTRNRIMQGELTTKTYLDQFIKRLQAYCAAGKNKRQDHTKVIKGFLEKIDNSPQFKAYLERLSPLGLLIQLGNHLDEMQATKLKPKGNLCTTMQQFLQDTGTYATDTIKPLVIEALTSSKNMQDRFSTAIERLIRDHGDSKEILQLLADGANPNAYLDVKTITHTLFTFACMHGLKYAELLLQYGADPNFKNAEGQTVLSMLLDKEILRQKMVGHSALYPNESQYQILERFKLEEATQTWNVNGITRFVDGTLKKDAYLLAVIKFLVENGADVNAVDTKGNTALHWLCTSTVFSFDDAMFLLKKDINPLQQNRDGRTAFDCLNRNSFPQFQYIEKLTWLIACLDNEIFKNDFTKAELIFNIINNLLDNSQVGNEPNIQSAFKKLLNAAILHENNDNLTQILLSKIKDQKALNAVDNYGHTILSLCILQQRFDLSHTIVRLQGFININAAPESYGTPLHLALEAEQFELIIELLERGANPNIPRARDNTTVLDLLEQQGYIKAQFKASFIAQNQAIEQRTDLTSIAKIDAFKVLNTALITEIQQVLGRRAALNQELSSTVTAFFTAQELDLDYGDGDDNNSPRSFD